MRVQALVFDFDGLILDTEGAIFHSWGEAWAARGIELTLDEWAHCIGTVGGFDPEAELVRRTGRPFSDQEATARRHRRDEILAGESLLPGISDHLAAAEKLDLPVAIASSSPRDWIGTHLPRLGIDHHFRHFACFENDGSLSAKPAPDLYLRAVALLGVDAHHTIAFEDSVHGVTAATAAGLRCVAVPGPLTRHLDFAAAHLVIESLADSTLEEVIAAVDLH